MKLAAQLFVHSALVATVAFGLGACEVSDCSNDVQGNGNSDAGPPEEVDDGTCVLFKSLKNFNGTPIVESAPLGDGNSVTVISANGNIDVIEGADSANVSVTVRPKVARAYDTPPESYQADLAKLTVDVTTDGDGNVEIQTSRNGGRSTLSGAITVELPQGFSGGLELRQNNGSIDVGYIGNASSLLIVSDNGSIDAPDLGNVPDISITNGGAGSIDVGVSTVDSILLSSSTGDVTASIGAIADAAGGGSFKVNGLGDIELRLPSTGAFSLEAQAGEVVDFGDLKTCEEAVAAENSKTLTCSGGGAQFTANAVDSTLNSVTVFLD